MVVTNTKHTLEISKYIEVELNYRGFNILKVYTIPYIVVSLNPIADTIKNDLPNGGFIINLLENGHAVEFLKVMYDNKLLYPDYKIMSFYVDIDQINNDEEIGEVLENQYFWNTFNPFTVEPLSSFTLWYNKIFTYRDFFSSMASAIYTSLSITVLSLINVDYIDAENIRVLLQTHYITCSYGTITLARTNVFDLNIYLS